jgi:four helix bundle protein
MSPLFDHEKLKVYRQSLAFAAWCESVSHTIPRNLAVSDQLSRATSSIALNLAEATGKPSSADRCNSFDNARGSALECAACLDVVVAKNLPLKENVSEGKSILFEIVCMLVGLIRANSRDRLHEDPTPYEADPKKPVYRQGSLVFDHERLEAYKLSLGFISWVNEHVMAGQKAFSPFELLDRASTAIPLSIAEGNGKFTMPDRRRFFDSARSSSLRCASFWTCSGLSRLFRMGTRQRGSSCSTGSLAC